MAVAQSGSRFKFTPLVETTTPDGVPVETYGAWVQPPFFTSNKTKYNQYIVPNNRAGRVDQISNDLYGTPEYFWVLIAINKPLNPLNWPKVGDILYAPDFSSIASEM